MYNCMTLIGYYISGFRSYIVSFSIMAYHFQWPIYIKISIHIYYHRAHSRYSVNMWCDGTSGAGATSSLLVTPQLFLQFVAICTACPECHHDYKNWVRKDHNFPLHDNKYWDAWPLHHLEHDISLKMVHHFWNKARCNESSEVEIEWDDFFWRHALHALWENVDLSWGYMHAHVLLSTAIRKW